MDLLLNFTPKKPDKTINYLQPMLFTGSCFADEIALYMQQHNFNVVAQPFGTVFNPVSIAAQLERVINKQVYTANELVHRNELFHSWEHHTQFTNTNKDIALETINAHVIEAHQCLHHTNAVVWITLGSAFAYQYHGKIVANCHKYPATDFSKKLLSVVEITSALSKTIEQLEGKQVVFTVSPVRHTRDGLVENNRSKSRLIEAVHQLTEYFPNVYYFPAYEFLIDVLRDYRFYAQDMVHPNSIAVKIVWEHLVNACFDEQTQHFVTDMAKLLQMQQHKALHPETEEYKKFIQALQLKENELSQKYFR